MAVTAHECLAKYSKSISSPVKTIPREKTFLLLIACRALFVYVRYYANFPAKLAGLASGDWLDGIPEIGQRPKTYSFFSSLLSFRAVGLQNTHVHNITKVSSVLVSLLEEGIRTFESSVYRYYTVREKVFLLVSVSSGEPTDRPTDRLTNWLMPL